jgi:hypothetical protein
VVNRVEGSEAERLLRLDLDENKETSHAEATRALPDTTAISDNYSLKSIPGHIDQEERRRKYIVYLKETG